LDTKHANCQTVTRNIISQTVYDMGYVTIQNLQKSPFLAGF